MDPNLKNFQIKKKKEDKSYSDITVCYQRGLPRLVSDDETPMFKDAFLLT